MLMFLYLDSTEIDLNANVTNSMVIFTPMTPDDNTRTHWLQQFEFYIIISLITLVAAAITISLAIFMASLKMCHLKKGSTRTTVNDTTETGPDPEPVYESIADATSRGQELGIGLVTNDAYSVKGSFGLVANDAYTIKYSFSNMVNMHDCTCSIVCKHVHFPRPIVASITQ